MTQELAGAQLDDLSQHLVFAGFRWYWGGTLQNDFTCVNGALAGITETMGSAGALEWLGFLSSHVISELLSPVGFPVVASISSLAGKPYLSLSG
jgi:hypothetical protein